jgi:hypothetical protein
MDDDERPDDSPEDGTEEERSEQVRNALLKALGVVVVIAVVIALGTTLVVRALGLDENDSAGPVGSQPDVPTKALPTTALPDPGQDADAEPSEEPSQSPSASATPSEGTGDIQLDISPVRAGPGERVNLTGSYQGADNLSLEVQRFEDGAWRDFGVQATVRVGTFATYVQTQRTGEMRFRMFDPTTKDGSNVVLVTIGG